MRFNCLIRHEKYPFFLIFRLFTNFFIKLFKSENKDGQALNLVISFPNICHLCYSD